MQLTITFIKEKKSIIYSYLISSFSFSLKRFALSILCNWQWLPSKKEIHNIFLPYLFIFFQSEKIRIKHSMQLIITFIKEKKSIYIPTLSLIFFLEKIRIKHSMQLTITFIKEKKSIIYSYLISSFCFSLKRLALSILCNWQ